MKMFVWAESLNDGSWGGNASASIIAPSIEEARALLRREWDAYLAANHHAVHARSDGSTYGGESYDRDGAPDFFGIQEPRFYATGVVRALLAADAPAPTRVLEMPGCARPYIALLAKGYEG